MAGNFVRLDDSPMFMKQVNSLEQTSDDLKDRCQMLYKGCKKFMTTLGDACNGDVSLADSLEAFGGGQDDPISVSIGGPVLSKFITAFRELASYKELLRSQVEHVLLDRLMHFITVDLHDVKDSRKRFDKSMHAYDQSREKFMSLKKGTRGDIIAELEEDLQNSKSSFEKSRFNLVNSLVKIEAKKKYEFLESFSAIMDAHLRYFKLGYDLLSQLEPFIHQVLTYAQQSKELANIEQDKLAKRIQEYRTQTEMEIIKASNMEASNHASGVHPMGMSSYKNVEAIMQSTTEGEVQTIKQGYLLKRSSSLRGDWKRRFFVLDSHGTLYYYRSKGTKSKGYQPNNSTGSAEHNSTMFSRFRSKQNKSSLHNEENLGYRTVDLSTSTIKIDAEDSDLRLCFRIISPAKTYTLQAENGADRMDWTDKITGVIASLLKSHILQQPNPGIKLLENNYSAISDYDVQSLNGNLEDDVKVNQADSVSKVLREIPGNDLCAECSAPDPDWASLNLGILLCIECSGVHRNLGVHISKVRSITLDVKVWEPTILDLFRTLGNIYCNSVWEEVLQPQKQRLGESNVFFSSITKPCPKDAIHQKEKYIHAKYVEKSLLHKEATAVDASPANSIWEAVKSNNLREVYRIIVKSDASIINTTFNELVSINLHHTIDAQESEIGCPSFERKLYDPSSSQRMDSSTPANCLQRCSLLHLACHLGNQVMVELLLQFGADINMQDFHGRTPLHHCISRGNNKLAKFLLRRGAHPSIKDGGDLSALERAMELGAITDEELFLLLAEGQ